MATIEIGIAKPAVFMDSHNPKVRALGHLLAALDHAEEKHRPIVGPHEGYGVAAGELREAVRELRKIMDIETGAVLGAIEDNDRERAIAEFAQVGCVALRCIMSLEALR